MSGGSSHGYSENYGDDYNNRYNQSRRMQASPPKRPFQTFRELCLQKHFIIKFKKCFHLKREDCIRLVWFKGLETFDEFTNLLGHMKQQSIIETKKAKQHSTMVEPSGLAYCMVGCMRQVYRPLRRLVSTW